MLRSSYHLSELLRDGPDYLPTESSLDIDSEVGWAPRERFKPGRFHHVKFVKPVQTSESTSILTTTASKSEFRYMRRLSSKDQPQVVRLINILAGRQSDPVVCQLQYHSVECLPYYEAISYFWGVQCASVVVERDGQSLKITESLSAAIKNIRREGHSLLMWADAICIDQGSNEEKNSQVPLMRQIYQNAAIVQVWLGSDTPTEDCREAFYVLQILTKAYYRLGWAFHWKNHRSINGTPTDCNIPALNDPSWQAVGKLVQRPWFSRAWIIQEIVVSQRAVLRCGRATLAWGVFHTGLLFAINAGFLTYQLKTAFLPSTLQQLIPLLVTYSCFTRSGSQRPDFLSLLEGHRSVNATDPKDKIYALIGLSTEVAGHSLSVTPDYSSDVVDVYMEVAKAIITNSITLDILGVPRPAPQDITVNLPSWVPDWSTGHRTNSLCFKDLKGDYVFDFDAAYVHQFAKHVDFCGRSLILHGHVFDAITNVGQVMDTLARSTPAHTPRIDVLSIIYIVAVLHNWKSLCTHSSTIYTDPGVPETLDTMFVRVLRLNDFTDGRNLTALVRAHTRFTYRVGSAIWSHLISSFLVVKTLQWYEAHLIRRVVYRSANDQPRSSFTDTLSRIAGRCMVITKNGYNGLASGTVEAGDRIVLVKGGRVPLVLRPVETSKWMLVGDCYVHGIMHGEGFEEEKCVQVEIV